MKHSTVLDVNNRKSFRLDRKNIKVELSKSNLYIFNYFYNFLLKYWQKNRNEAFNEIFFHKVISEVIRNNIEALHFITRGWYLYGIEIAKPLVRQDSYVPERDKLSKVTQISEAKLKSIEKSIITVADEFDPGESPFHWEGKQYKNQQEKVYESKLNVQIAMYNRDYKKLSKYLSNLSMYLSLKKQGGEYPRDEGVKTLLYFVDIANKVIISNNFSVPKFEDFKDAFEKSWKCFASVNLELTAEGIDADGIKLMNRIPKLRKEAENSVKQLQTHIKSKNKLQFPEKSNKLTREIMEAIHNT